MKGVYINRHFTEYMQAEFPRIFAENKSNWWGRSDNFRHRKVVFRSAASQVNDPYGQIYYAVRYDKNGTDEYCAYIELAIRAVPDGENFDELIDELHETCPENNDFYWKDNRTLRVKQSIDEWPDAKNGLSKIMGYTQKAIEDFFRQEQTNGEFETCEVEIKDSESEVALETFSLQQLFSMPLCIPEYQRIYCWDEKTIRTLWNDIQTMADNDKYRLGTIILQKTPNGYDIIDGQQRLVTLSLFLLELNIKGISLENQTYPSQTAEKYIAYNKYVIGNLLSSIKRSGKRQLAKRLWSDIEFNVLILNDSSIDLAYTFFSNENSRGKALSDFDLLKAHHLRFVTDNAEQAMHLASKWDKMISDSSTMETYDEKDYVRTLSVYIYRLRHWIRNSTWDEKAKYRVKHEYEAAAYITEIPPFGGEFGWNESIQGGAYFFGFADIMRSRYKSFVETSAFKAVHKLDTETHWWYRDVIESMLFGYYLKFGESYLADALYVITKYVSLHRLKNGRANLGRLLRFASESSIVMMIDRASSPTFFLAELLESIGRHKKYTLTMDIQQRFVTLLYKCMASCAEDVEIKAIADLFQINLVMNNHKFTPQTIDITSYSIPLYQRLFEWDCDSIEQLLKDLFMSSRNCGNSKTYYIGMLTSTSGHELVDGQQRFTVMMLMGIILRDYDNRWEDFLSVNSKIRLSFLARLDDEKYLEDIIARRIDISNEDTPKYENMKMKKGIRCISDFMESNFTSDTERRSFSSYVYEKMTFFVTYLPPNYRAAALNKYFERMNSTGKNLEGHEIIKVRLLRLLDADKGFYTKVWNRVSDMESVLFKTRKRDNAQENTWELKTRICDALKTGTNAHAVFERDLINGIKFSEEYEGSGNSIEQIQKRDENPAKPNKTGEGTHSIMSFSDFLLQCLYVYLGNKSIDRGDVTIFFNRANIVRTFETFLINGSNAEDIRMFFETMLRYRILLDVYFIRTLDNQGEIGYDLESPHNESAELENLKMFEEMIYVNSAPATYYQWFGELIKHTDRQDIVEPDELYKRLKEYDDDIHPLSKLETDKMSYPNIDRYWFWRLDFYLWQHRDTIFSPDKDGEAVRFKKAKEVADRYVFKRNRSIEHIAPQTPLQESTLILGKECCNSFGNLVMISSQQNSSLSNSIFQEKLARVEAHLEGSRSGSIESLKMLHAFTFNISWNEKTIREHGKIMMGYLQESYK